MNNGIICSICGEEVNRDDLVPGRQFGMINGAILWKYIEVTGHKSCVYNVDRNVVTVNRLRLWTFLEALKEILREEGSMNVKIQRALQTWSQLTLWIQIMHVGLILLLIINGEIFSS